MRNCLLAGPLAVAGVTLLLWTLISIRTDDPSTAHYFREVSDADRTWTAKFYWYDKGGYYGAFADFYDEHGEFLGRRDVTHGGSWEDVAEAKSRCEPIVMTRHCIRIDEVLEPITPTSGGEVVIDRHEVEAAADSDAAIMTIAFVFSNRQGKADESVILRGNPIRPIQPGESLAIETDEEVFPITVLAADAVDRFDGRTQLLCKGVLRHQIQIGDRVVER